MVQGYKRFKEISPKGGRGTQHPELGIFKQLWEKHSNGPGKGPVRVTPRSVYLKQSKERKGVGGGVRQGTRTSSRGLLPTAVRTLDFVPDVEGTPPPRRLEQARGVSREQRGEGSQGCKVRGVNLVLPSLRS